MGRPLLRNTQMNVARFLQIVEEKYPKLHRKITISKSNCSLVNLCTLCCGILCVDDSNF